MNLYLQSALSPSTRHTYCSGFKVYYTFCKQISQRTFPLKESILQLFVTSLAGRLKYSSIKVYLCGIQYQSIICGFQEKIATMGKLYYVMRGIRRVHSTGCVKQRLPITPSHLRDMISFVQNSLFSNYDKAMWKCLILLAFFGLLRVSEYVCPGQRKYDPSINLMPSDVKFCGDIVYINLKASKTDPFRAGFKVRLVRIGGNLCPVTALIDYIVYRGATVGRCLSFHLVNLSQEYMFLLLSTLVYLVLLICTHIAFELVELPLQHLAAFQIRLSKFWVGGPVIATEGTSTSLTML